MPRVWILYLKSEMVLKKIIQLCLCFSRTIFITINYEHIVKVMIDIFKYIKNRKLETTPICTPNSVSNPSV